MKRLFENIVNKKFGKLTPIKSIGIKYDNRIYWLCKCDCGNVNEVSIKNLKSGAVKSCGCSRKKINRGAKQGLWKGDRVSYKGLHLWLRNNYKNQKPSLCENCKKPKILELSNKSGKYKRDINDFEWLCRRCHMEKDGRINMKRYLLSKITEQANEIINFPLA